MGHVRGLWRTPCGRPVEASARKDPRDALIDAHLRIV
jgi:hypothetical protein